MWNPDRHILGKQFRLHAYLSLWRTSNCTPHRNQLERTLSSSSRISSDPPHVLVYWSQYKFRFGYNTTGENLFQKRTRKKYLLRSKEIDCRRKTVGRVGVLCSRARDVFFRSSLIPAWMQLEGFQFRG